MSKIRTFIAVELPGEVRRRAAVLIGRLAAADVSVRWVEPENMHLTLKFLGDIDEEEIPSVCRAVQTAAAGIEPLSIRLIGAGAFPNAARPRTIWLGVGEGAEELTALQAAVDDEVGRLGFPREGRQFKPHLTLGRVRSGGRGIHALARLLAENAAFDAGDAPIEEAVVFASQLDRDGPRYSVLGRGELGTSPRM